MEAAAENERGGGGEPERRPVVHGQSLVVRLVVRVDPPDLREQPGERVEKNELEKLAGDGDLVAEEVEVSESQSRSVNGAAAVVALFGEREDERPEAEDDEGLNGGGEGEEEGGQVVAEGGRRAGAAGDDGEGSEGVLLRTVESEERKERQQLRTRRGTKKGRRRIIRRRGTNLRVQAGLVLRRPALPTLNRLNRSGNKIPENRQQSPVRQINRRNVASVPILLVSRRRAAPGGAPAFSERSLAGPLEDEADGEEVEKRHQPERQEPSPGQQVRGAERGRGGRRSEGRREERAAGGGVESVGGETGGEGISGVLERGLEHGAGGATEFF